jgi:putative hydrolase of the HAD superfamily
MVAFAEDVGIDLQDLVRVALGAYTGEQDDLVTDFETGQISEEQFSQAFAARLATVAPGPVDPTDLVRRMFQVELEEPMLAAVARARSEGIKTALLSNSWGAGLYPRDRLEGLFEAIVISGEVGLRKPDPAIFRLTLQRLTLPAEACVFVDDHPGHLAVARDEGLTTVLHRSPRETIAELESLLGLALA